MRGIRDWIFFKPRRADYEVDDDQWPALATFIKSFTITGQSSTGPFTHTFTPWPTWDEATEPQPNPHKNGPPLVVTTNSTNLAVPITPANTRSFVKTSIKKPP